MAAFAEMGLNPELIAAIEKEGWQLPTPIQAEAIPLILGGGDCMAAAETGSGKTGAFVLPILQIVHEVLSARQAGQFIEADSSTSVCKLNVEDRDDVIALADEGLRAQTRDPGKWGGVRGTAGFVRGQIYYEAEVVDEGLCRVGWSVKTASLDLGTQTGSYGYGGTGKKSTDRKFEDYGEPYGQNDVIGCLLDFLDLDAPEMSFTKNGKPLGVAFRPREGLAGRPLHPAVCMRNAELLLNFGNRPFKHAPSGFVGAAKAPAELRQVASTEPKKKKEGATRNPTAIILEPSKDLAEQTAAVVSQLQSRLSHPSVRSTCLLGGEHVKHQIRELEGDMDIVTGTPGRIMDLVEKGRLVTDEVKFFVLDEADRLLETCNLDTILKLYRLFPRASSGTTRLQVLMFSATLHSDEVRNAASRICQNPILVDLKGKESIPDTVNHVLINVEPRKDRSWLQNNPRVPTDNAHLHDTSGPNVDTPENWSLAVKRLKPRILQRIIDQHKFEQALIFCRTNFDCDNLEAFLKGLGGGGRGPKGQQDAYSCMVLAGQRSMDQRREALQAFKDGEIRFLICTDVAARGIDIVGLPYIINMTLPDRSEDYIHRVGRVGRAGKQGLAVSLVSVVEEKVWYCRQQGYKPWLKPSPQDVKTHDEGGHTIWYNEQELLREVEGRLKQRVVSVAADLSLPPALQERVETGGQSAPAYGEQRSNKSKQIEAHQELLRPAVLVLADLERRAQATFFDVQRFAKPKVQS